MARERTITVCVYRKIIYLGEGRKTEQNGGHEQFEDVHVCRVYRKRKGKIRNGVDYLGTSYITHTHKKREARRMGTNKQTRKTRTALSLLPLGCRDLCTAQNLVLLRYPYTNKPDLSTAGRRRS